MNKLSRSQTEASSRLLKDLCEKHQLPDSDAFKLFKSVNEAVVCCKRLENRGFLAISPTGSLGTLISNDYTYFAVENNTLMNEYDERMQLKNRQKEIEDLNFKVSQLQVDNLEFEKSNQALKTKNINLDNRLKKWGLFKAYWWVSAGILSLVIQIIIEILTSRELVISLVKWLARLV